MLEKVNLTSKLAAFDDHWHPRIVGTVADCHVKLAKFQGAFVWHSHTDEDELFLVLHGRLTMRLRDGDIEIEAGEFLIVPRGVEHMPVADEEVHVLLFEPKGTLNTGNAQDDRTVSAPEWL